MGEEPLGGLLVSLGGGDHQRRLIGFGTAVDIRRPPSAVQVGHRAGPCRHMQGAFGRAQPASVAARTMAVIIVVVAARGASTRMVLLPFRSESRFMFTESAREPWEQAPHGFSVFDSPVLRCLSRREGQAAGEIL